MQKQIDWDGIEREYRLGQKSMRAIASQFNVNVSNISRRAKKYKWPQDKSDEVRARTNATLIAQHKRNTPSPEDIQKAVETNTQLIYSHRSDIRNGRKIANMLSQQLQVAAENRDELEDIIVSNTENNEGKIDKRKRNFMMKAVSLPVHSGVLRDLAVALKYLIPLERQAFGIDTKENGKGDTNIDKMQINIVGHMDLQGLNEIIARRKA